MFFELEGKRFFRTGDLASRDEEGYFFITDRLKRMINASGFKVWPAEVESLMYKHPAIQEVCIIGTQDAYRGESVKAMVVSHGKHDKVRIFKLRRRKHYKKSQGHRQNYTELQIVSING